MRNQLKKIFEKPELKLRAINEAEMEPSKNREEDYRN